MKTRYKYIHFVKFGDTTWHCLNSRHKDVLGYISYYAPWRQWTLHPANATEFSADCLADIQHFMGQLAKPKLRFNDVKGILKQGS
jgi:hypothetical protein